MISDLNIFVDICKNIIFATLPDEHRWAAHVERAAERAVL